MFADVTFFESQCYFEDSGSSSDGFSFPSLVESCESAAKDPVTVEHEEARPSKVYCRRQ